ncbi:MAG: hypothetical protein ACJA1U_000881 [Bermanella sp.]|jgi:hypothetical protein
MNKTALIIFSAISLMVASIFYVNSPSINVIDTQSQPRPDSESLLATQAIPLSLAAFNESEFISNMAKKLKTQHDHEIHRASVQMTMQDFRNFVREQYPKAFHDIFTKIMHLAFSKYADDILLLVANMDKYDAWYADHLLALNDMDPLTKKGTIWQKRREIFGDLADEIWKKELTQEQEKRQTVQQTIEALNQADNMAMEERLYVLQNTLDELYPEEQTNFTLNKGIIANVYFQLDSVQKDLRAMTAQERKDALAKSRKQMGFSEKDIDQLAEVDEEKQQRWENGYEYMSAREQLNQKYSGNIPPEELNALRKQYFKNEAPTIAAEESSGFFRYQRPRLFGSN